MCTYNETMLLEPYAGKLARTVLRGERGRNAPDLLDSSGDPETSKTAASWFGACIFLVVVGVVLQSFFL